MTLSSVCQVCSSGVHLLWTYFVSQPFMFVWLLLKNESLVLKPRINLSVAERVSRLMDVSKGMNPNPRHRTSMASPVSGTGD